MVPVRVLRWILAAFPALILTLLPGAASADATITVGTGGCTLANALTAAQTGTPHGGCPAGDTAGVTTIELPPGTYADHDLQITSGRIVLRGHSATDTTIDAQGLGRVFDVGSGAYFAIDDVTLERGLTSGGTTGATGTTGAQGGAGGGGGAILNAGTVTIFDSVLTLNGTGGGGTGGTGTGMSKPGGQGGAGGPGGAVDSSGTLEIAGSTFSQNKTGGGGTGGTSSDLDGIGGLGGAGGAGGAVAVDGGAATISASTFSFNVTGTGGVGGSTISAGGGGGSGGEGGAIAVKDGTATVITSTIDHSSLGDGGAGGAGGLLGGAGGSGGPGGGVANEGTLTLRMSTIAANTTGNGTIGGTGTMGAPLGTPGSGGGGGGISTSGPATIAGDAIVANATGDRAATGARAGGGGGIVACVAAPQTVSVDDSTITENTTPSADSEAIEVDCGSMTLLRATVAGNSEAGAPSLGTGIEVVGPTSVLAEHDSLVSDNGTTNCAELSSGRLSSQGHNLNFPDLSCPHELTGNPRLGSLSPNGGPTESIPLQPGSAALDAIPAGDSSCAQSTDQRGVQRPVGRGCDVGAFEVTPILTGTPSVSSAPNSARISYPLSVGTATNAQLLLGISAPKLAPSGGPHTVGFGSAAQFTVAGLRPRTTYFFELRATSPFGSLTSTVLKFTTPAATLTIISAREDHRGRIVLRLRSPAAGRIRASAVATVSRKGRPTRRVSFGPRAGARTGFAKTLTLTLAEGSALKRAVRRGQRVRVVVTAGFTPTGGRTSIRTIDLHITIPKKR